MMETTSSVPPGFRFHPTDEELVGYYLTKKVASQKIDLDVIRDVDLYRIEPWDLQERCRIGYEEQREWYFFSHKDKKYPTGTRTNRATMAGFWKATGRDKAIYRKSILIGMRKTLVFYTGRAPNGQKTDWIIHEYRLESSEDNIINAPPQEEGWVVCRAFKKKTSGHTKTIGGWNPAYFCDEPTAINSILNPIDYVSRQQPQNYLSQSLLCKQELELAGNLSFTHSNQFTHELPQLESPSLPLINKPSSSTSLLLESNEEEEDQTTKVSDWKALDKFVASQLSQEDRYGGHGGSYLDMQSIVMHGSGRDEDDRVNGFLSSNSDLDIGICIFDN